MSTWDDEVQIQKWLQDRRDRGLVTKNTSLLRFLRWPNPFTPHVDDIEVLMCEHDLILLIKGAGLGFGYWWFTTFVPSPAEIARKVITGGYGCGFYLIADIPSPLDIIGKNRQLTKLVARIARPFAESLFYLWGQQAIFEALSTWQSLVYSARICDAQANEILLGAANTPQNRDTSDGVIGLIDEIYDPNNWKDGFGGQWIQDHNGISTAWWSFSLLPTGVVLNSFSSWVQVDGTLGTQILDYQEAVIDGPNPTVNIVHSASFENIGINTVSLHFAVDLTLQVPLGELHILTDAAGGGGATDDNPDWRPSQMNPWSPQCH